MTTTQKTLKQPLTLQGVGIHSGLTNTLTFEPAPPQSGIQFIRTDLDNALIPVNPSNLQHTDRATLLTTAEGHSIRTPEHLLAACAGYGITNLRISCSAEEVPIFDGSSLAYCEAFSDCGIQDQGEPCTPLVIQEPIWVSEGDAMVMVLPGDVPQYTYHFSYPNHWIEDQTVTFSPDKESFFETLSQARTFGFRHEIDALLSMGLAKGASLDNALVIEPDGYSSDLRYTNELALHKCLDLVGDCWVLNRPIQGHVIGIKSGHKLTASLVQRLAEVVS